MAFAEDTAHVALHPAELEGLHSAVDGLTRDKLLWASGYLAGLAAAQAPRPLPAVAPDQATVAAGSAATETLTVLYATETGNSRRIAERLAAEARGSGLKVTLTDIRNYRSSALKRERRMLLVIATHGLGDPPEGTEPFFEYVLGPRAPRLEQLKFSVLALGDSSYEDFCVAGARVDERLAELGATRLAPRVECDLDYEDDATSWTTRVLETVRQSSAPVATVRQLHPAPKRPAHTRDHPFLAELIANQKITARDSSKDVRHIELSLEGSGLTYQPGDSLGVIPTNPAPLVAELLKLLGDDGATVVTVGGQSVEFADALSRQLELTLASRAFIEQYAQETGNRTLAALLEDRRGLAQYLRSHQVIDILREHPATISPQALAASLRRLTPRLYSIASSPLANPEEAHLTVAVVAYHRFGHLHLGAASGYLAGEPDAVPVYVEPNDHFRLPADPATPIIMIGPGTGVAPFRAFVEQRRHLGAQGRNWLVYGDRTRRGDFLYQLEWLRYLKEGVLTRLDVAFSRDQDEKVYVQHRLAEHGRELYGWLEEGAHLYVCGDADRMAPDVQEALVQIVAAESGRGREDAEAYLTGLKAAGRYQRDVY